jgi:hypothetical protein
MKTTLLHSQIFENGEDVGMYINKDRPLFVLLNFKASSVGRIMLDT